MSHPDRQSPSPLANILKDEDVTTFEDVFEELRKRRENDNQEATE